MRKFTFLRKKIQAKDRSLQEKLVTRYFEDLDLNDQDLEAGQTGFNSNDIYNRIIDDIDAMPVKPAGINKKWMVAASLVAIAASSAFIYQYRTQVLDVISPIAQHQIATINGQVANLTLADGTKVWLNGGSKLSYPEAFRGDKRQITLTGEAFFEVAHDATKAFIVHTGDIKTQVLGTSFNVKAYPEDKFVKVDVATGKVGVVARAAKTVFLLPSHEVMVDKANHSAITSKGVDVNTLAGWKSGDFNVKNMPLPEVLNAIYHRYNIQVKADANLVKCSITANFTNVSLQNIIKIISKLVRGRAYADGPGYYLKGKGC
ncbi:FecR family protein [Mucilaginibacter sp. AK015]|uniref:FecR family protein n=1 Tax=Mucilaginibacter sp. AK015 TaxID=2723072 RepID=UPI00161E9D54|nr:FecR family protein [Mucilaginibacter sp. AK015]MBB5394702.1 ferric-dicitrate binding protein FerR (iron transport regulator) [Mucilaginibacter sp. AK015]